MTFPSVVEVEAIASAVDENENAPVVPADWDLRRGDLLFVLHVEQSDGGGPGNYEGPSGYCPIWRLTGSNHIAQAWVRVCDGSEAGEAIAWNGFNSTGKCAHLVLVRGADPYVGPHCGTGSSGASGTAPDAPNRDALWGVAENLWLEYCCGFGSAAITGVPTNGDAVSYSGNSAIVAATTNAVAAAFSWTQRVAGSDNPSARARASGAWKANTIVVPPVLQSDANRARVRFCQTREIVVSGSPDETTVRVEGGPNTRIVLAIEAQSLTNGNAFSAVLDPGGADISLTLMTDGVTLAQNSASGPGSRFYTTLDAQNLAPGDYTLRISGSYSHVSGSVTAYWLEIENAAVETVEAHAVQVVVDANSPQDSTIDTTIDGLDRGLMLMLTKTASVITTAQQHTVNGLKPMPYGAIGRTAAGTNSALYVARTLNGTNNVHLSGTQTSFAQHALIVALGAAPQNDHYNAPLVGAA